MIFKKITCASLVLAWLLCAGLAHAAPVWDGMTLQFHQDGITATITPLSDDVVRVRLIHGDAFGRDHSYAVVTQNLGGTHATAQIGEDSTTLSTGTLNVTVQQHPFRIRFANKDGKILDEDTNGISFDGTAFRIKKALPDDEHIYGLGEKSGRLDKRGWQLGGYTDEMWNTDTYTWDSSTDPLYVSVPFYVGVRRGLAHGIFLDNTWRSIFDIGRETPKTLAFGAEGGEANYYFINGPSPKQVIERYTELTGRMPLPPLWAVGYQQCRYSYYPEARVRKLASDFRREHVPADGIWLDIHYLDNYKPFTWNHERFPNPRQMISDLAQEGFHLVTIIDPHPNKEPGYPPYDSGLAGGFFVKNKDDSPWTGNVWPSQAPQDPQPSVFPDFSNPAARTWWGSLYKGLVDDGVAGIWNDMDEPSVFVPFGGTMAPDAIQDNEGLPTTHRELHNVYGQLMTRSTFDGLAALRTNERPFVLTRSSFAGGQRYAAVWTGDNTADWAAMRQSICTDLGMGVSGFGFVGTDVGGFVHTTSAELFTRWLQLSIFYPFMRTHTDLPNPDKEPWSFGPKLEMINRRAIELRYELLPYIYNAMHEMAATGVPAMRPLFVDYPEDETAGPIDDEFLFGSDLLVAPVVWEGATTRPVYFPTGNWFDYWTGKRLEGGRTINIDAPLNTLPLFVKAGAFVFRQPVIQYTGQMPGNALHVLIAPAAQSEATLHEDDGESLDYARGEFMSRQFHQAQGNGKIEVEMDAPTGLYRPQGRDLELEIWSDHEPKSVLLNGAPQAKAPEGWAWTGHSIIVKTRDRFERLQLRIDE